MSLRLQPGLCSDDLLRAVLSLVPEPYVQYEDRLSSRANGMEIFEGPGAKLRFLLLRPIT